MLPDDIAQAVAQDGAGEVLPQALPWSLPPVGLAWLKGSPKEAVISGLRDAILAGLRRAPSRMSRQSRGVIENAVSQLFDAAVRPGSAPGAGEYRIDDLARLAWEPEHFVISFHGLPQKYAQRGDPYPAQVVRTTRGLVERLGVPVVTVPGHPDAMKITTRFDLAVAEALLVGGATRGTP